ncbi:MAG: hypothetical protein CUN56_05410 [Phototrophicales bacterium]|nr:MAG: hypothetical protein CUN56_05410 [Phototrophicales bacterium]
MWAEEIISVLPYNRLFCDATPNRRFQAEGHEADSCCGFIPVSNSPVFNGGNGKINNLPITPTKDHQTEID